MRQKVLFVSVATLVVAFGFAFSLEKPTPAPTEAQVQRDAMVEERLPKSAYELSATIGPLPISIPQDSLSVRIAEVGFISIDPVFQDAECFEQDAKPGRSINLWMVLLSGETEIPKILTYLEKHELAPANLDELLAFALATNDVDEEMAIIAFDSWCEDGDHRRGFPVVARIRKSRPSLVLVQDIGNIGGSLMILAKHI